MTGELRIYETHDRKRATVFARVTLTFKGGALDGCQVGDILIHQEASLGEGEQVRSATLVGLQECTPLGKVIVNAYRERDWRLDVDLENGRVLEPMASV